MPNSQEGPGVPLPSLEDLLKQYKTLTGIPDESLDAIGYIRVENGRIIKKRDLDKYRHPDKYLEARKQEAIRRKAERVPFETLRFRAQRGSLGRKLSNADETYIDEKLDVLTEVENMVEDGAVGPTAYTTENLKFWLGDGHPAIPLALLVRDEVFTDAFVASLQEPLQDDESESEKRQWRSDIEGDKDELLSVIFLAYRNAAEDAQNELMVASASAFEETRKLYMEDSEEYWPRITSEGSLDLHERFERIRGRLADPDFYRLSFRSDIMDKDKQWRSKDLGYESPFRLLITAFSMLLENRGFSEAAEQMRSADSLESALAAVPPNLSSSEEEKAVRVRMKNATIDEKKTLSRELKAFKERREQYNQIFEGMRSYLDMPSALARVYSRAIRKAQDRMVYNSQEEADQYAVELILDARPNPELDQDPGVVSGDCTVGMPLPFADPNILVYNVKVFEPRADETLHIGNIYLLETEFDHHQTGSFEDLGPVWHIEAIQVPSTLDWDAAARNLFKELARAAKAKGITHITINPETHLVSNYDYIGIAVLKLYGLKPAEHEAYFPGEAGIVVPLSSDSRYSSFQGGGHVAAKPVEELLAL